MAFDAHSNFGYSNVAAPAPGLAGTSLTVAPGQGALFPAAPFNCTVWPAGVQPTAFNAEIVRVTAIVGDTLTITRTQEGSTVVNIEVGFQIANTTSRKVFTDIEAACVIGAGTQTVTGPFTFVDSNGISFGMDNGSITASVNTGAAAGVAISAGGNSQSTGTVVFSNANGITFGLDGAGNLTASHNGITAQSTQPVAASASNGSFLFSTLGFTNANGISFGTSAGGFIFASHNGITSQTVQPVAASATNGSFLFSTLRFTDAFNVTFGTSAGGIIFASVATAAAGNSVNFSAGTQSSNLGSIVFANSNGIEFGLSNGTITARDTLALTAQTNPGASASNGSFSFQTLNFSDANGVTFGTSAGGIITASVNAAAGGVTVLEFEPLGYNFAAMGAIVDAVSVQSFEVHNNVSFTQVGFGFNQSVTLANNNSTGGVNFSFSIALLTGSGGTLQSISSTTGTTGMTMSSTGTTNNTGAFSIGFDFTGVMTPGTYWAAVRIQTTNTGGIITGANTTALAFNHSLFGLATAVMNQHIIRSLGNGTNLSAGFFSMIGLHATTNMTSIQAANMSMNNSGNRACLALKFKG